MVSMNTEVDVRQNWNMALEHFTTSGLSEVIGYGFTRQDLLVLCCLHEANKNKEAIENLLKDCNFHAECNLLQESKYKEYKENVFEHYWCDKERR